MNTPNENNENQAQNFILKKQLKPWFQRIEVNDSFLDACIYKHSDTQIPLLKKLRIYSGSDCDPWYWDSGQASRLALYFPNLMDLKSKESRYIVARNLLGNKVIDIAEIYSNGSEYIIKTETWFILCVDKNDFQEEWIMAATLRPIKYPNTGSDKFWDTTVEYSLNHWHVSFYKNNDTFFSFPWDKFEYFDWNLDGGRYWNNFLVLYNNLLQVKQFSSIDDIKSKQPNSYNDLPPLDLNLWKIVDFKIETKKNFIFVVTEDVDESWNKKHQLHILRFGPLLKDWIVDEAYCISWINAIYWSENTNLTFWMDDWSISVLWTNFNEIPDDFFRTGWQVIKEEEQKIIRVENTKKSLALDALDSKKFNISIDKSDIEDSTEWSEKEIVDKIWNYQISLYWEEKTLEEFFNEAHTEDEIYVVYEAFKKIKKIPELIEIRDSLKAIEKKIIEKQSSITLQTIYAWLNDLSTQLEENDDFTNTTEIKKRLLEIKKKRRNIQVWAVPEDKVLKELLDLADEKIKDYRETNKEKVHGDIEENLTRLKQFLDEIDNTIDITGIYNAPLWTATDELISFLDEGEQATYKKKMWNLVSARIKEIKDLTKAEKEKEKEIIENKKKLIENNIEQVKDIVDEIEEIDAVEAFKESDSLVKRIEQQLDELENKDADNLRLKLENIFKDRIFTLRVNEMEVGWIIQNLDSFWIDRSLYYNENWTEQVNREISGEESKKPWYVRLIARIKNWGTQEYDYTTYLKNIEKYWKIPIWKWAIKFEMTDEEFEAYWKCLSEWKNWGKGKYEQLYEKIKNENNLTKKQELKKEFKELWEYYLQARYTDALMKRLIKEQKLNPRSKVPELDPEYIVLDEEKKVFKELSARLIDQKVNWGCELLQGWPWLGKTVMCNFLASVTNREIIRVQCRRWDPDDFFFSRSAKNGSTGYDVADWIELMKKPGTIILFDEIDKLSPACFEMLHSLFDKSRTLYHKTLGTIKSNPDCLFIATKNGYQDMSSPILNRSREIVIKYPSELNECYKISKYTSNPILKKLSHEEFWALYDKYIQRKESAPKWIQERKIYDDIINIKHLLGVFTYLRRLYDADDSYKYELSYRDARQIFVDYNNWKFFKDAIVGILLPKTRDKWLDKEEKSEQEKMLIDAINYEYWK